MARQKMQAVAAAAQPPVAALGGALSAAPDHRSDLNPAAGRAAELAALADADAGPRPAGWRLTPRAVRVFLLGGEIGGVSAGRKHFGDDDAVETAIAVLAAGRALLLLGPPGVGKSHLSALLADAVCGDARLVVQGAAGTEDGALRYGWDYARLIAEGPSEAALAPSPVMRAMRMGRIARIEELTRMSVETQDALVGPLSERAMAVAELGLWVEARPGFNLIATANDRDRGVRRPSAALLRRFAVVRLSPPPGLEAELALVSAGLAERGRALGLPACSASGGATPPSAALVAGVRIARAGRVDGAGGLSSADLIDAAASAWAETAYLADPTPGAVDPADRFAAAFGQGLAAALAVRGDAPSHLAPGRAEDPVARAFSAALAAADPK